MFDGIVFVPVIGLAIWGVRAWRYRRWRKRNPEGADFIDRGNAWNVLQAREHADSIGWGK